MGSNDLSNEIDERRKKAARERGRFLHCKIRELGLPKYIVAERADISRPALDEILSGETVTPDARRLQNLAQVLRLGRGELLRYEWPGFFSEDTIPGNNKGSIAPSL
jgi:hypothetical protein